LRQWSVFGSIEFMAAIHGLPFLLALAGFREHRRNASILRIDDERRAPGLHYFCSAVPPEVVVRTRDVLFCRTIAPIFVATLYDFLFVSNGLLCGEEFLAGQICRSLHWGDCSEAPRSLKVRLTVRGPQCCGIVTLCRVFCRCLCRDIPGGKKQPTH